MNLPRVFSLVALSFLAGQPCLAQTDESGSTSGPEYRVEVIAFQYLGPDSSGGESLDLLTVEDYLPGSSFDIDEYNRVQETVSYTNVGRLGNALERLRTSPQYSVLAASAWVQPLLSQRQAVDVPLEGDAPASTDTLQGSARQPAAPRLKGTVRVYGGQLLFVDVDIRAALPRRPGGQAVPEQPIDASGNPDAGSGGIRLGDGFRSYRISETRRIKLDEIHYFDHPYIGAVISVTRHQ